MFLEMRMLRSVPRFVREDREFYVPDRLSELGRTRPDLYAAADEHARELREAEKCLDEAVNLVGTLRAALAESGSRLAMQADTILKIVEERVNDAHSAIDRHDTRFMNLFMAYFDRGDDAVTAGGD